MSDKKIEELEGQVAALRSIIAFIIIDAAPPTKLARIYIDTLTSTESERTDSNFKGHLKAVRDIQETLKLFGDMPKDPSST